MKKYLFFIKVSAKMTEILKQGGYVMKNLKLNISKNNPTLSNSVLFWWWP